MAKEPLIEISLDDYQPTAEIHRNRIDQQVPPSPLNLSKILERTIRAEAHKIGQERRNNGHQGDCNTDWFEALQKVLKRRIFIVTENGAPDEGSSG